MKWSSTGDKNDPAPEDQTGEQKTNEMLERACIVMKKYGEEQVGLLEKSVDEKLAQMEKDRLLAI